MFVLQTLRKLSIEFNTTDNVILRRKNTDALDTKIMDGKPVLGSNSQSQSGYCFSENIDEQRGVRQGCILSPLFFNIYSEANFGEAIAEGDEIKTVNRLRISDMLTIPGLQQTAWMNE